MKLLSYSKIIWQLLKSDFVVFKKTVLDKLIDLFIWLITMEWVFAYLMPSFGLSQDYASFMVAGLAASAGLFEVFPAVMELVGDINGERIISFYATLPIPNWAVFLRYTLFYTFNAMAMGFLVLPISKILIWDAFDISHLDLMKYLLIFLITALMSGAITLWTTSWCRSVQNIGSVWMRFIYPLWFLGGFQFSWKVLHSLAPYVAYANLLNPYLHIMESYRSTILGPSEYLPLWISILAMTCFTVLFFVHGAYKLKRQLDFV